MTTGSPVRAGASRAEEIARLHERAFEPPWDLASLSALLAAPGALTLIVEGETAGTIAGFIMCRSAADEAEIMMLAVDPARRRQGIGRSLVAAAIGSLEAAGIRRLYLEVAVDNPPARLLYQAVGCSVVGERRGYYHRPDGTQVDALVLARPLGV